MKKYKKLFTALFLMGLFFCLSSQTAFPYLRRNWRRCLGKGVLNSFLTKYTADMVLLRQRSKWRNTM